VTDIEIASAALNALGTEGITSFEDDSDEARAVGAFYPTVRDLVLGERVWSFAKAQFILDPHAEAPLFGWERKFQLPADVIRVYRVDDGSGTDLMAWELQGRFILANDATRVYVTAVRREEDSSLYSPGFSMAVTLRLAAVLAVPLKENRQLKADLWEEYKFELKEASGVDGTQGKVEQIRSTYFSDRRQ
jgi:hypothetical protein